MPRFLRNLGAAAALAVSLLAAGCSTDAPRNSAGQVTASADSDAFALKVGDCTGALGTGSIDEIPLVPCGEPHDYEAYASMQISGDTFPGTNQVQDQADTYCATEFTKFVGIDFKESKYSITNLMPTKESWSVAGDREVLCLAGKDSGKITGSLQGAKK
ncbi:MAG: septum formation family protein [Propionibacteriaceae bacterium]|nr:septum formation family protein [Propionibacteriaceae bacterium]